MQHQSLRRLAHFAIAFFFILFSNSTFSQTFTAKQVSIIDNSGGYYEYLPQGYSSTGTQVYPLILFVHGLGELGNGTSDLGQIANTGLPRLIKNGSFPSSFTVNNQTHRFIVIAPQFKKWPKPAEIDAIINYAIQNYKVNVNRVYLTGLSMGGGVTWEYAGDAGGYASRLAAIVPIAGASYPAYTRAFRIADAGLPVWATHNNGDPTVSVDNTIGYIDWIVQRNPSDPAKKTIFTSNSHDAWTKTYDPNFRENGMNVYEWMLQYQRGNTTPPPPANKPPVVNAGTDKSITLPTNSVQIAATASDPDGSISSYVWTKVSGPTQFTFSSTTVVSPTVSNLVEGSYIFRLTVTDNAGARTSDDITVNVNPAPSTGGGSGRVINVNIYGGSNPYNNTEWNNWNVGTVSATNIRSSSLKYSDGTTSSVVAELSHSQGVSDNYAAYGGTMAPAEVVRYASFSGTNRTLTISGLSASTVYSSLELYASRRSSTANTVSFTVNGQVQSVSSSNNLSNKLVFTNVASNPQGQIIISISKSGSFSYINGFKLTESGSIVTTPPPSGNTLPLGRTVNVNLYGGSNGIVSSQWNNWSVRSNVASAAFKYSDGTTSSIKATLSHSKGISDNYASYGSGMAPAEVLRYASFSDVNRTLILSGLAASSTYSFELYSSRRSSTSNTITFSVNGQTVSVNSSNNLTNKVVFNGVTSNAQGQIVITIDKSGSFSYINGFKLTEGSTVSSTTSIASTEAAMEALPQQEGSIDVYPNPFSGPFTLQINNNLTGPVQVKLVDMSGVVKKQFSVTKTVSGATQIYLSASELPAGNYILQAQMEGWSASKAIIKQ